MSGHSKWSKVKHQKATTDVAKAVAFTKASRAITVAVREGGGNTNPDDNFHLRLAIEKARDVNMPKTNIDRIIEKAKGMEGASLHSFVYEAYGPYGVALLIEGTTDNPNRTVSFVKQIVEYAGGSLASPGAVAYLFTKKGLLTFPKKIPFDQMMDEAIEAGADDVVETDDVFEIYTSPTNLNAVQKFFVGKNMAPERALLIMLPNTALPLTPDQRARIDGMMQRLEELEDVDTMYSNAE